MYLEVPKSSSYCHTVYFNIFFASQIHTNLYKANYYLYCSYSNIQHEKLFSLLLLLSIVSIPENNAQSLNAKADLKAAAVENQVIEWRWHFYENPKLLNRESETAKQIAEEPTAMVLGVDTRIAKTGVIGVLDTTKPGPTIAMRADIDGLPVAERDDLPFKSTKRTTFLESDVSEMHACGHDTHIAMLLGATKILTSMKSELTGKFVFIFQPEEESAPPEEEEEEEGDAKLMVKESIINTYGIDVFFGQLISSTLEAGKIRYKVGGIMAASS